mgnify:CR=1 FL=1
MRTEDAKIAEQGPAPIAEEMLRRIAALYAIEAEIRGRTPEARLAVRRAHALPIVAAMEPWLRGKLETVPGKSDTARAIRYALGGVGLSLFGAYYALDAVPLLGIKGKRTVDSIHRQLGNIMWEKCGMARTATGLKQALQEIPSLREEFWKNVTVPGSGAELNQSLEKAGRLADFLEFAELMCLDALHREESCGGHFREEHQTEDGEAKRDDANFAYVAAWEYAGDGKAPTLNKEPLQFENVHLSTRSYK